MAGAAAYCGNCQAGKEYEISIGPRERSLGPFICAGSIIGSAHDRPVWRQPGRDNVNIDYYGISGLYLVCRYYVTVGP